MKTILKAAFLGALAAASCACMTPLMKAASNGDAQRTQMLIDQGANINAVNDGIDKWTALHIAAYSGQVETVRILIRHGADTAARTAQGWTALDVARQFHHPDVEAAILQETHSSAPPPATEPEVSGRVLRARKRLARGAAEAAPEPAAAAPAPTAEAPAAATAPPPKAPEPAPKRLSAEELRGFDQQLVP